MLISFFRYLKGYVRIRLQGYSPERFLNLCRARDIEIWDLKSCGLTYEMNLGLRDFRKLKPLRKKARAHVVILERHGLPFFLYRNRNRKMFPAGILLCIAAGLPHVILYIPAGCWLLKRICAMPAGGEWRGRQWRDGKGMFYRYLLVWLAGAVVFLAGAFLESYVNPLFLKTALAVI